MRIPVPFIFAFLMFVGEIFIEQNGSLCFTLASREKKNGKKAEISSQIVSSSEIHTLQSEKKPWDLTYILLFPAPSAIVFKNE